MPFDVLPPNHDPVAKDVDVPLSPATARAIALRAAEAGVTPDEWATKVLAEVSGLNDKLRRVTCNMGLNRSGLLSALTLRRLGVEPERAVALVRRAREIAARRAGLPHALFNEAFLRLVLAG